MFCRFFSSRRGRRPLRGHWLGEIPLFFRDVMKSLPPRGRGTALAVEGACVTFDLHKFHCNALSLTRQGTPLRCVASFLAKTWSGAPSRREPFSGSVYGGSTRSPTGRRRRRPLRGHWLGEIPSFFRDVMKSLPPRGRGTALAVEGAHVTLKHG